MANKGMFFVLAAGLCSAVIGTLIGGVYIAVAYGAAGTDVTITDVLRAFGVGVMLAAIPASLFAFVAGVIGGALLFALRHRLAGRRDFAIAAIIIGSLLGSLYVVVAILLHWTSFRDFGELCRALAFVAVAGAVCGAAFAVLFSPLLLAPAGTHR